MTEVDPHLMRDVILKLCRREDLTRDETRAAFLTIMSGSAPEAQIGGFLIGLAAKGTTVDELVGAATVMREKAVRVVCDDSEVILDTCGTGGDTRGTFNISTAAALIVAGGGVKVVKHGNRSATSRAGSADVLERMGVRLDLSPSDLSRCVNEANICFAFAREHHPAMKHVASSRAALGVPTVFNMLGPLANPAGVRHHVMGVFAPELTGRFAQVLRELGSERAWVVHGADGLDELSTLGPTRIAELKGGAVTTWMLDSSALGIPYARLSDLTISNVDEAADVLRRVLDGEKGPRRDIALLNAAAAFVVAGKCERMEEGLELAAASVDSGKARETLEALVRCSRVSM